MYIVYGMELKYLDTGNSERYLYIDMYKEVLTLVVLDGGNCKSLQRYTLITAHLHPRAARRDVRREHHPFIYVTRFNRIYCNAIPPCVTLVIEPRERKSGEAEVSGQGNGREITRESPSPFPPDPGSFLEFPSAA